VGAFDPEVLTATRSGKTTLLRIVGTGRAAAASDAAPAPASDPAPRAVKGTITLDSPVGE
jgi:hypothetical protein